MQIGLRRMYLVSTCDPMVHEKCKDSVVLPQLSMGNALPNLAGWRMKQFWAACDDN